MITATITDTPRIYVASLSDYNAGILHGAWIDADQDADAIQESITEMLLNSPRLLEYGELAEEWAIHDTDNFPNIGENPSLETVSTIGTMIDEHGDAFTAWIDDSSYNTENPENFTDEFRGEYESVKDYAYQFAEESGIKRQLLDLNMYDYINWQNYGESLLQDGWYCDAPGNRIYVFGT